MQRPGDDGISYGDYLEQITYLIFLKMDDENALFDKPSAIPAELRWRALFKKQGKILDGEPLEAHYIHILTAICTAAAPAGRHFSYPGSQNEGVKR